MCAIAYAMVGKICFIFWQLQHYNTVNILMVAHSVINVLGPKKALRQCQKFWHC